MTVRFYESTNFGAPSGFTNAGGGVIAALDACLVNGFAIRSITSIVRSGATATVTCSGTHGLRSLQRVTVSGCDQAEYNGDKVITVTSTTEFTYTVSGTPVTPATGTITGALTPAGWTKPFSGTNLAAYLQGGAGNNFYFRFSDPAGNYGAFHVGYETMTDINTGTGMFPTSTQLTAASMSASGCGLPRGSTVNGGNVAWKIFATETAAYIWSDTYGSWSTPTCNFIGSFQSFNPSDIYNKLNSGTTASNGSTSSATGMTYLSSSTSAVGGNYNARDYLGGIGGSVTSGKTSVHTGYIGSAGVTYSSAHPGGLLYAPVFITDATGVYRGICPGFYNPLQKSTLTHGDTFTDGSKTFLVLNAFLDSTARVFMEITNGW